MWFPTNIMSSYKLPTGAVDPFKVGLLYKRKIYGRAYDTVRPTISVGISAGSVFVVLNVLGIDSKRRNEVGLIILTSEGMIMEASFDPCFCEEVI